MRITTLAFTSILLASFLSPSISGHEPKEYTILLTQDGTTPQAIPDDVLVQTDYLFFINVDEREGVSHRIQFDADDDGLFNGSDDFSSNWLSSSCDLDENGSKVDESCMVTEAILLGPENGFLPGTIRLRHQTMNGSLLLEQELSVTFMEDLHNQPNPEVGLPQMPQENSEDGSRDLLVVILFTSLMGILAISPSLITRD